MNQIYDYLFVLAANNVPQHRTMSNVDLARLLNPLFGKNYSLNPSRSRGLFRVISLAADARHKVGDHGGAESIRMSENREVTSCRCDLMYQNSFMPSKYRPNPFFSANNACKLISSEDLRG